MEIIFDKVTYIINYKTSLEKTILNNISFEIKDSGVYSFVGASNSGKSAIGDIINALVEVTSGKVKIGKYILDGRKYNDLNKLRSITGYVFRNPYDMFFNKTVEKEIKFAINHFNYKVKDINKRVLDALKLVNLDESYLKKNPFDLSLVEAKKIAFACALVYNPKIIILDEITNGLNYSDRKELLRLIRLLTTKYKKTIILLSKDTSFCYQISDYVYLMYTTKIVASGDKRILEDGELLKNIKLEEPNISSFVNACNKKGHDIYHYTNIHELIKGVFRDVY